MDPRVTVWLEVIFRWFHVVAGVMWIGHLWFFNFVNAQVAKTYDADSKKKVIPELMPRALYWFRWGAAWTFITGILLLALVYYMGGNLIYPDTMVVSVGVGTAISLGALVVGFLIYDMMWKALAKQEMAGMVISLVLLVGVAYGLGRLFTGRAVFIHIGGLLGTIMAANVWMRIWPGQRKIIAAIKAGTAPDPAVVAIAGLRSKHNTYMSMPLIFLMVSNHFSNIYGYAGTQLDIAHDLGGPIIAGFVIVGWGVTKLLYGKAASDAPKFV